MENIQQFVTDQKSFYIFTEEEKNLMKRFAKGELTTKEFRKLSLKYLKERRENR